MEELALKKELRERGEALKGEQGTWVPHWRELADYVRPRGSRFLASEANQGGKKGTEIINGTPMWAERTLAAGLAAGVTSPSRPWFRFGLRGEPEMQELAPVKQWLRDAEDAVYAACARSNAYNCLHVGYSDLGVFGTTCLHVEEDAEKSIRVYNFPLGSYALSCNEKGEVDTLYRWPRMTVRQCVRKFGLEKCSESVQRLHNEKRHEVWVDVVHCILPNEEYVEGKLGPTGKRFLSYWFEASSEAPGFLSESGYFEAPIMAPRWFVTGEDVYGTSPGMAALGDCKALQHAEKRAAQMLDKLTDPPMQGPSALRAQRVSILPGDMNYVDSVAPGQSLRPAHEVNPAAATYAETKVQQLEARVNRAFYADLWLMLQQADGKMTAREVVERREEKLLQLGPVLERLQMELLDPFVMRVFFILSRQGRIPVPPQELQGMEIRIEYVSIMAQAQKMLGMTAVERVASFVVGLQEAKPDAIDKLDVDQAVDEYAALIGVPPVIIRPDDEVEALRQARAQAAQQQQQLAAAQQTADTAKTLADTDTSSDNALTEMRRALGAA